MWQDVSHSVIVPFKQIFSNLEDQAILDVNNEVDLFYLHAVFTGRINSSIEEFIRKKLEQPSIMIRKQPNSFTAVFLRL